MSEPQYTIGRISAIFNQQKTPAPPTRSGKQRIAGCRILSKRQRRGRRQYQACKHQHEEEVVRWLLYSLHQRHAIEVIGARAFLIEYVFIPVD